MPDDQTLDVVLLPVAARSDERLAAIAAWHLIEESGRQTWCGTDIGYGALRRSWDAIPRGSVCLQCSQLGYVRYPDLFG